MLSQLETPEQRNEWIQIRNTKFLEGDDFKPRVRTETIIDAEKSFVSGLYWATILCTSVALDHLGFNILNKIYKKKKAPSAITKFKIINEMNIITDAMLSDIEDFINMVRHEIEHKRSPSSVYVAIQKYLDKKNDLYYDKIEPHTLSSKDHKVFQEKVLQYTAFQSLNLYFVVCDEWYEFLVKKNQG